MSSKRLFAFSDIWETKGSGNLLKNYGLKKVWKVSCKTWLRENLSLICIYHGNESISLFKDIIVNFFRSKTIDWFDSTAKRMGLVTDPFSKSSDFKITLLPTPHFTCYYFQINDKLLKKIYICIYICVILMEKILCQCFSLALMV